MAGHNLEVPPAMMPEILMQLKFVCLRCKYIGPTNVVGVTTGRHLCPNCESPVIPGDGVCRRVVGRVGRLVA
jgi:hypothetical protein